MSPSTLQYITTKEWQTTAKSNAKPNDYLVMDDSIKRERRSIMV